MTQRLVCALGVVTFVALAWAVSSYRSKMPWRVVLGGLGLQFALAVLVLKTTVGLKVLQALTAGVERALDCTTVGTTFVFESFDPSDEFTLLKTFAFSALPTIIFFSSLMSVLYYVGVMQKLVAGLAWVMRRTLGTSGVETLAASANVFVGMTEAPLVIKPYLRDMTRSELMAMMVGGFATVTGGLLGAYASFGVEIEHLLTACIISAPAALVIAKVMLPETEEVAVKGRVEMVSEEVNVIGAAVTGASDGMRLAINVAAMLIAFLALIALGDLLLLQITYGIEWLIGRDIVDLSIGLILSYAFWPLAFLLGIPPSECFESARLIGLKTVANEFLAYAELGPNEELSERTRTVLTYALAGFSNLGAIGIQVGGIGALEPSRKTDLARFGLRAMFGGLLACLMTGAVVGVLL